MQVITYTDGSYQDIPGHGPLYAGAAILVVEGQQQPQVLTRVGNEPGNIELRNVAGEIAAVLLACEYCRNTLRLTQTDTLVIYHDYVGIANWCKSYGEKDFWKAKKPLTISYRDYMNSRVKTQFKVEFHHVKGHSKNVFNDTADELAKKAIEQYVSTLQAQLENG